MYSFTLQRNKMGCYVGKVSVFIPNYTVIIITFSSSSFLNNKSPVLLSKRQTEENVNASIFLLIARRMREGYTVDVREIKLN